jgi:hypothetical protein
MAKYSISVYRIDRTGPANYETDSEDRLNSILDREKNRSDIDVIFVNKKLVWRRRK